MLKLLKSILGRGVKKEKYPEAMVTDAIERVAEKTDPWLRSVSDYRYKLRQSVIISLEHVEGLVNRLPPPLSITFDSNESCSALAVFFTNREEMLKKFQNDRELAGYLRDHEPASKQITALLMMEKMEKTIFGAELSGDVVARDVPQTSVTFQNQQFLAPAESKKETRRRLEKRAFDHLLKLAQRQITTAKSTRKDLERRQTLLQAKLTVLQRENEDLTDAELEGMPNVAEILAQLRQVEAQLKELGGEDKMLNVYLDITIKILSHPEEHLWGTKQQIILDQSGIKRAQTTENSREFVLQELCNSEGRKWVTLLVTLHVDELRNFCR
ncbi:MAG: hypothetical protein EG822_04515 [Deltaproteobacteria bacterium]|nr:hypothetical protein [Deltaproteobacteria bacterium]TLN01616.1 MAG: hypothetical protein FDZ73_15235 [bacterium]